jgi:hypothetical protein
MANQDIYIDDLFLKGLGNYTEVPPADVWVALENRLDGNKGTRKPFIWWWFVIAVIIVAGGMYLGRNLIYQSGNIVNKSSIDRSGNTHLGSNNESPTANSSINSNTGNPVDANTQPDNNNSHNNAAVSTVPEKTNYKHNFDKRSDSSFKPVTSVAHKKTPKQTDLLSTAHKRDHLPAQKNSLSGAPNAGTTNASGISGNRHNPITKKTTGIVKSDTTTSTGTNYSSTSGTPKLVNTNTNKKKKQPISKDGTLKNNIDLSANNNAKKAISDSIPADAKKPLIEKGVNNKPKKHKTEKSVNNIKKPLIVTGEENKAKKPKIGATKTAIKKPASVNPGTNNNKTVKPDEYADEGKLSRTGNNNGADKQLAKHKTGNKTAATKKTKTVKNTTDANKQIATTENKTNNIATNPTTTPTETTFKPDKIQDVLAAGTNGANGIPITQNSNSSQKGDFDDTPPSDNLPGGGNTGGGGGGGGSQTQPEKPVKFDGGVKAAYTFGSQAFSFNSAILSLYFQYYFSQDLMLLFQPGVRMNMLSNDPFKAPDIFYDNVSTTVGPATHIGAYNISSFTQTYDSISKKHSITNKTAFEIEMPVALKFKVSDNFAIFGGPVFTFGRVTNITTTSNLTKSIFNGADSAAYPAAVSPADVNNKYHNSFPYSSYDSTQYENPENASLRLGLILGLSATIKEKFSIDLSLQQNLGNTGFIPNTTIRKLYTQPYIRIGIGFKIF